MARRRNAWTAAAVTCAVVVAACSNADTSDDAGQTDGEARVVDAPGVTSDEIRVGGVVSATNNPVSTKWAETFDGVDAYFQMVNDDGGVHGRELNLVARHDDQLANNAAKVKQLVTQDDVFAVLPVVTALFTGADELVDEGVPTFGWTLNREWETTAKVSRENLFGQAGSFLCVDCASPTIPYLAGQIDATKVGVLGYSIPESKDCITGVERSFETYTGPGVATIAFTDAALSFGVADLSVQVQKMKTADVDLVFACMDLNAVVLLAKEMKKQELDALQLLANGYDPELLTEFGNLFQGSYVLTFFAPFEVEDPPEGLQPYLDWMERTGTDPSENSMNGWLNAALFVEGLRDAGPDFSRQSVIDAINQMTDWDADGLLPGVDWTRQHAEPPQPTCVAYSLIEGEEFVPAFGEPGKPFVCMDRDAPGIPEGEPGA